MFDTAEEAAAAYNKVSKETYGEEGKINKIKWSGFGGTVSDCPDIAKQIGGAVNFFTFTPIFK